jgi:hypothetical protein
MKFLHNLLNQVRNSQCLVNINLELNSKITVRCNKHPALATTFENIRIKKNWLLVFMLVIESMDKHNIILVDTMDRINIVELDIDNNQTKFQEKTFKLHLKYLKEGIWRLTKWTKMWWVYYIISTLFFVMFSSRIKHNFFHYRTFLIHHLKNNQ